MIGMLIEGLVCVLLAATIAHCLRLDRKLKVLKADEQAMRRAVVDLVSATEKAERAVAGLRSVVEQCDQSIAGHLRDAERQALDLAQHIRSGDDVIARISRIVETGRGAEGEAHTPRPAPRRKEASAPPPPSPAPVSQERLAATLAAAQAFAERARRRVDGKAA